MPMHIANFNEADRRTAYASQDFSQLGLVIKITDNGSGLRLATPLANSESALLVNGNYGVAYKVSIDPFAIESQNLVLNESPAFGDRTVQIKSGDAIVEVRRRAIIEYSADMLDASLDPSRGGTTPTVDSALAIHGSLWCAASVGGAITSPVVARVYQVFGTSVMIELV